MAAVSGYHRAQSKLRSANEPEEASDRKGGIYSGQCVRGTDETNDHGPPDHPYDPRLGGCKTCSEYHNFHHHRLRTCQASEVYGEVKGLWKCDACDDKFSDLTSPCHHCDQCKVDLCETCFGGEWTHALHDKRDHQLTPVDPRIEYRLHMGWKCDNCNKEYSANDDAFEPLFHCTKPGCEFDLCRECFTGKKSPVHQHPVVLVHNERDRKGAYVCFICSHCQRKVDEPRFFRCRQAKCDYRLCTRCCFMPSRVHPLHRDHPLQAVDSKQAYPQTGGRWHCNNCTENDPLGEPRTRTAAEVMYHCETCQYDLCEACYISSSTTALPHSKAQLLPSSAISSTTRTHYLLPSQMLQYYGDGKNRFHLPPH